MEPYNATLSVHQLVENADECMILVSAVLAGGCGRVVTSFCYLLELAGRPLPLLHDLQPAPRMSHLMCLAFSALLAGQRGAV